MKTRDMIERSTTPNTTSTSHSHRHAGGFLPLLLLLMLSATLQAQFGYTNDHGKVTLTGYTGPGGAVTIPETIGGLPVTRIDDSAFCSCTGLTSIMIPDSVITIGSEVFSGCTDLKAVYFRGDAPSAARDLFLHTSGTVHYMPGTTGWGPTFAGRQTAPWVLSNPVILDFGDGFGVRAKQFGFVISWATNANVVVEACEDPARWSTVSTNALADGWVHFTDPEWANHPVRFYRVKGK